MTHKPKPPKPDDRCEHTTTDGRRCRLPRINQHSSLCRQHWQRQHQLLCPESLDANALELLGPFQEFNTARAINHALGKLFALLAKNRIPVRNAAVLAYLGQVLLNSLALMNKEILPGNGNGGWRQLVHHCTRPQRPALEKTTGPASVTPDEKDDEKDDRKDDEQKSRSGG